MREQYSGHVICLDQLETRMLTKVSSRKCDHRLSEEARARSSPQCSVIIVLQFLTKAQIGLHTTIYPVITLAICVEYHNHLVIMAHNQFQSHDT